MTTLTEQKSLHHLDLPLWKKQTNKQTKQNKTKNKAKFCVLETHSTYAAFLDRKVQISAWLLF